MRKILATLGILSCTIGMIALVGLAVFGHPTAHAQVPCVNTSTTYCLLEPLPTTNINGQSSTYASYTQSATSAASYINLIIQVFISIIGVLGVVMIIVGGVEYMTTDAVSGKSEGREKITNAIFGLLLALASWLILFTINPHLLDIRLQPPQGVSVDAAPAGIANAAPGTAVCSQSPTINGTPITMGMTWGGAGNPGDDTTLRQGLSTAGVVVYNQNCPTVGSTGCTSLAGYTSTTVNDILALQQQVCGTSSGCTLTITGGTECWLHTTHGPGLGAVDFEQMPVLNTFITGSSSFPTANTTYTKTLTNGATVTFLAEQVGATANTTAIHWHTVFPS